LYDAKSISKALSAKMCHIDMKAEGVMAVESSVLGNDAFYQVFRRKLTSYDVKKL
jgi:hypothetical protein